MNAGAAHHIAGPVDDRSRSRPSRIPAAWRLRSAARSIRWRFARRIRSSAIPATPVCWRRSYIGPSFAIDAEDARLAFAGADAAIEILDDANADKRRDDRRPCGAFAFGAAKIIRVGSLKNGATLYIAVEGGFDIEPVLGSVATDSRGKMGGWHGRALIEGDVLPLRRATAIERDEYRIDGFDLAAPRRFRAVLGPQSDYFSEDEIERFFAAEYTVSAGSNRMGMRLEGPPLRHRHGFNIVSDAIATGSIQVPGNGQPIVLLADHQTTGGYPKIATVISADLPALGRLPIGSKISFTPRHAGRGRRRTPQACRGARRDRRQDRSDIAAVGRHRGAAPGMQSDQRRLRCCGVTREPN